MDKSRMNVTSGQEIGRWHVLQTGSGSKTKVRCRCTCGNEQSVVVGNLLSGGSQSCGCATREAASARMKKHGSSKSPEYSSWLNAKARCHNQSHPRYPDWGGKGIAMCERWRASFENFLADMGKKPSPKHSIDRIDGSKGYEPGNCRWATPKEQSENRPGWSKFITFNGETKTVTEWAKRVGLTRESLRDRLKTGWSVEQALTVRKGGNR